MDVYKKARLEVEAILHTVAQKENAKNSSQPTSSTPVVPDSNEYKHKGIVNEMLWNQLHVHQRQAVDFIIDRLTNSVKPSHLLLPPTGAVLADDMGTGKVRIPIDKSYMSLIYR